MSSSIKLPPSERILKTIRLLAILAVSGGALAFSVTHFAFPRVGFEGMLVLAGLAIWFSILCIAGAFVLCCFIQALAKESRRSPYSRVRPKMGMRIRGRNSARIL